MSSEPDWSEPQQTTLHGCAACGETHEMDWFPLNETMTTIPQTEGVYVNAEPEALAAGICPNEEKAVIVYGGDWKPIGGFSTSEVCSCEDGEACPWDDRFCVWCCNPLPEYDWLVSDDE